MIPCVLEFDVCRFGVSEASDAESYILGVNFSSIGDSGARSGKFCNLEAGD